MTFILIIVLLLSLLPEEIYIATEYHDEGDYEKAIEFYEKSFEISPDNYLIIYNAGNA